MNGCKVATNSNVLLKIIALIVALASLIPAAYAQDFKFEGKRKRDVISFESIKNLVVIPLYINGKGPFSFILDTGVGPTIITDSTLADSLKLKGLRPIKINGLGKGKEINAKITSEISVSIGEAKAEKLQTVFIEKDPFNLSAYLGKKIYGLIGYSFFNEFVVGINYSTKRLSFSQHPPRKIKGEKIPIELIQLKPYITATVEGKPFGKKEVKLIVDCGAGHALSLEKFDEKPWAIPTNNIDGNLGVGLAGEISGKIARADDLYIGRYHFKNVVTNFPEFDNVAEKSTTKERNGNLGADILRRFDTTYDYQNGVMYLKKNAAFREAFEHDMSGMEIYGEDGFVFVARVEEGSAAEKAGILPNDQILGLNFKSIEGFTLNEIVNLLKYNDGSTVIVELYRKNKTIVKLMRLKRRI